MNRAEIFNRIPIPSLGYNRFDLSHTHKTSIKMGRLYPTLTEDTLPGDVWRIQCQVMIRAAPMIAPILEKLEVTHYLFYVPNRIVWPNWEAFITGDVTAVHPYCTQGSQPEQTPNHGSLADYLGFGVVKEGQVYDAAQFNCLPVAGYNKIWNEYFAPTGDLATYVLDTCQDGENSGLTGQGQPLQRSWSRDYFTSCLPFPQSGSVEVRIPIAHAQGSMNMKRVQTGNDANASSNIGTGTTNTGGGTKMITSDNSVEIYSDPVHTGTIADLRRAEALQRWLEAMNRGGGQYRESLLSHYGVDNRDDRVQVPEYIGAHRSNIMISEVLSTAQTNTGTNNDQIANPVGQYAGHGISASGSTTFKYYCTEHGWIHGLLNVQPRPTYLNQGRARRFFREDLYDYYWPQFQAIGDQAVYESELYLQGENRLNVFGYIQRYAEYKFRNDRVSGQMGDSLKFWHLAREFGATPTLTQSFILADPRTDIFAVSDPNEDHLFVKVYYKINVGRKMGRDPRPRL